MSLHLFRRAWRAQVGDLDVSALDIEFKILCSIKSNPNKCVLTLWNASPDHRAQLLKRTRPQPDKKKLVGIPCQVEAGYEGQMSVLFSGDLREVASMREGADWKTIISGEDAGRAYREARINQTFAKGTPIGAILAACASAMGVGIGNAADFEAEAKIAGVGDRLPHAMTCSGSAVKQLTRVTESIGVKFSIQRGALQLMRPGTPLALSAIRLSPETGLLDSPEASIDASVSLGNVQQFAPGAAVKNAKKPKPKDPGILKLKCLLIPGLVPGRQILLDSASFRGSYMITEIEYVGQTWSNAWQADLVVRLIR